jgi:hypothetical protein
MKRIHLFPLAFSGLIAATLLVFLAGPGTAGLGFPHAKHAEAADCATCHEGAAKSQSGKESLLPAIETCKGCHEQADLEMWGWTKAKSRHAELPNFSHEKHLGMPGIDCAHCHGAISNPLIAGTGKGEISHTVCFACHDGKKATDDCASCHADVRVLRPLNHGVDYLHTHQFAGRSSGDACEECHRQDEQCSECHKGDNVLFLTHDRNYIFTHAQDARKHENDCMSCHDLESFCSSCHAAQGVRPANHDQEWITGANRHAIEGRRDMGYCASCHEGDLTVCVRCHRDNPGPRGADRNIHPKGMNEYGVKGPWMDDDTYYCFDCHQKSEPAEGSDGFCGYCHRPEGVD